jgi:Fur family ferric uptake transcriptional regulator
MIRLTRQRLAIEQVFHRERRPLTPAEVFEYAKQQHPTLGLRTVYRQLNDMANDGLIVGVDYPGQPLRYEWVRNCHQAHFICRDCNRVFGLPVEVDEIAIQPPPGFAVTGQETVFYGTCPDCNRR